MSHTKLTSLRGLSIVSSRAVAKGLAAFVILLFAITVSPTEFRYFSIQNDFLVRVNRFTGTAEYLTFVGWKKMQARRVSSVGAP